MSYEYLRGRRFKNLVRVSKSEQADTSPTDQNNILIEFGASHGMVHTGEDFILEGVSGSVPASRPDIQRIISRKRDFDDFDVLLVQDFSRFTRGGMDHASAIKWELAKEGIEVIFVTAGSTGDMDQDALVQGVGFYAAQQQAKSMSYNATRGQMSSIQAGNLPHTLNIPYGIDRLYVGPDGKSRHRIRNLPDGTQQKLEADRDIVTATFGRNPKKGATVHYHRQSDEKVVLIPGAPQQVETVRRIYRMKLLEGKGPYLIAKALNDEAIPSPHGKLWNTDTINSILTNSTYTGVGIADRYATGIYHVRGKTSAPKPVHRDLTTVACRKKSHNTYRPREEWRLQPHPHLLSYLDESMRELAIAYHEKAFEKQAQKALAPHKKQKPGGDSHGNSPYLLKDLLRSKQGNHAMKGCLSGPPNDKRRYYRSNKASSTPLKSSALNAMIAAEPLESAILDVVKEVLLDTPNLRLRAEGAHRKFFLEVDSDREQIAPLVAEQETLKAKLEDAFSMGPASRRLMKDKMEQWEARLLVLEQRVGQVQASTKAPAVDLDAFITQAIHRLASAAETLKSASPAVLRSVLSSLTTKLEVDLETRTVEMEITLPEGVNLRLDAKNPLCPVGQKHLPSRNETQWTDGLKIAIVECQGMRGHRRMSPCFTCSRRAA